MDYSKWREIRSVRLNSLDLDLANPRLPVRPEGWSQRTIVEFFLQRKKLLDLARRISRQTYLPHEVIVVTKGGGDRLIVLEGNRRVAACKILYTPELAPPEFHKKLESLRGTFDVGQLLELPALVAPNRVAASEILESRHIGQSTAGWDPLMQASYYVRLMETGLSLDELAQLTHIDRSKLRGFITLYELYRIACAMDLPADIAAQVRDPETFNASTIEKICGRTQGREFLGIEFTNDGRIVGVINPVEFSKGYKRILTDVGSEAATTRTVQDKEALEKYLQKIPHADRPDLKKRGSFTAQTFVPSTPPQTNSIAVVPSRTASRKSSKGKGVIPKNLKCTIGVRRIEGLVEELQALDPSSFENVAAISLRSLFDWTVIHHAERLGILDQLRNDERERLKNKSAKDHIPRQLPRDWQPRLETIATAVVNSALFDRNTSVRKAFQKVISDNETIFALHLFVHNRTVAATEPKVRAAWADLEAFFETALQQQP